MKSDGRSLDHKTLEHLRITACERVNAGESPSEVMRSMKLCRTSIYPWLRSYNKKGKKSLASKKAKGPSPLLGVIKQRELRKIILTKDPRNFGYIEALWSRRIISEIILEKFEVKMTLAGITKLLRKLNITPQKPLRRAYERDPKEITKWQDETLPKICKRARKKSAIILYLDEAGIRSDPVLGGTWGSKGQTPIVATSGQRQRINAISAVSPKGEFKYLLYNNKFNGLFFIDVLKKFTKGVKRPCFFIVDGHPSHKAKVVKDFIAASKGKIEIYFLPPYAPDLNPDEFVWNQIKNHGISKKPLRQNESLKERVEMDLRAIKENKRLVRSFFKARSVGYPSYL